MEKVNLEKLTGEEFDKYKKMNNIARNLNRRYSIKAAFYLFGILVLVLFMYIGSRMFLFPSNTANAQLWNFEVSLALISFLVLAVWGMILFFTIGKTGEQVAENDFRLYTRFNSLKLALAYKEKMIRRLKEYGYSDAEISGYFEVDRELGALSYDAR